MFHCMVVDLLENYNPFFFQSSRNYKRNNQTVDVQASVPIFVFSINMFAHNNVQVGQVSNEL